MPKEPRKLTRTKSPASTLKSRSDAARYRRAWPRVSKQMLKEHPLCKCWAVKVWDGVEVVERNLSGDILGAIDRRAVPAVMTDHIRPLSQGGELLDRDNLQTLCQSCHSKKTHRYG